MKSSVRKVLIFIVIILLIALFIYTGFNVFKDKEKNNNNKDNNSEKDVVYEVKELININDQHCDNGHCISEYSITQMEDGKFELKFKFINNNENAVKESCFKLYFSEEDSYIACYDLVDAGSEVYNSYILDTDNYSKYEDYSVKTLTADEKNNYYKSFEDDLVVERD